MNLDARAHIQGVVLQNIEEDNRLWQSKDRRTEKKHLKQEQNAAEDNSKDIEEGSEANGEDTEDSKISMNIAKGPPRFY